MVSDRPTAQASATRYRVGVDIGGTFTDIVLLDEDGSVFTTKVLSTASDYNDGILDGICLLMRRNGLAGSQFQELMHGTTIATNAILEHKGARTGLVTTDGFRDVLELRRLRMPVLFDLRWDKPEALVRRADRVEVAERMDHRGVVQVPLDHSQAATVIEQLLRSGIESLAICLLNAYANGEHEQEIARLVRERAPGLPVSISSEVLPEIKEYERTSTTVVNAYIMPVVSRYLGSMRERLQAAGIRAPLRIMQSSGGVMGLDAACERPIHIIESGPASGVVGAARLAELLGYPSVLTFDMGGTTAKASMVENGAFDRVASLHVGAGINMSGALFSGGGYPVRVPAIDIAEVGAGGGSQVTIDAGGALRVGPESSGASPGPVCYGLGGTIPTVTDANVVLGFVNPESLAGGSLRIDRERAAAAIEERVARRFARSIEETAWGIHAVADALMARAVRAVSSERGRDPRAFSLMAFGGNGGVHAATLARSLGIKRILVPPVSGVFSALGLLFPETEHHLVQTYKQSIANLDRLDLDARFMGLEAEGMVALAREGFQATQVRNERFADLRFRGQNTELTVPAPSGQKGVQALIDAFVKAHQHKYGFVSPMEAIEVVNLRVTVRGLRRGAGVPRALNVLDSALPSSAPRRRRVYFGAAVGWRECPVLKRDEIGSEARPGPVLIDEVDTTTVVPPDCRVRRIGWNVLEVLLDAQ